LTRSFGAGYPAFGSVVDQLEKCRASGTGQ
jgi:hypothetical protein